MTYRENVEALLADGWSLAGLYAVTQSGPVRAAFARDSAIRIETVVVADGAVPSIVDLAPAAGWDEREAYDLYGIHFDGHEPLRPLVDHDLDLASWTVSVHGHGPYQIAVGPIHAGVIESGHFRFHVVARRSCTSTPASSISTAGSSAPRRDRRSTTACASCRAHAPRAPSPTVSPMRRPWRKRVGSGPARSWRASARSSSSSSGSGAT